MQRKKNKPKARAHISKDLREMKDIYRFLQASNGLKFIQRFKGNTLGDRKDNSASHTWRVALLAILLGPKMGPRFDLLKALKVILVHDLCEVFADDISFDNVYYGKVLAKDKKKLEDRSMKKLLKMLPAKIAREFYALWHEFEEMKTPEGKFAQVMDKAEGSMHSLQMTHKA